jgi:hypothetical protein
MHIQVVSGVRELLKGVVSAPRLLSPECLRLFLVLPTFLLPRPLLSTPYASFAASLTTLPADWRALLGLCSSLLTIHMFTSVHVHTSQLSCSYVFVCVCCFEGGILTLTVLFFVYKSKYRGG